MKKIALIPNIKKDVDLKYTTRLEQILNKYDCKIVKSLNGTDNDHINDAELFIILGGDGAIMRAAHKASVLDIPILGINLGKIGYMAELEEDELELISEFFHGNYSIEERMMLNVTTNDGARYSALNDAVISNGIVSKMVDLDLYCDMTHIANYKADGLIIATPTGSTAYSMSAGGSIIDPLLNCILVTPVCPHSLTARPLVFSPGSVLEVMNNSSEDIKAYLTIDGGDNLMIKKGESVVVGKSPSVTKLVRIKSDSFYSILGKKML